MRACVLIPLVIACGKDATPAVDAPRDPVDSAVDAGVDAPAAFAVTSTAFTEGAMIPTVHTCDGANTSPALAWSSVAGAASYAVVFTDKSNMLIHWVIYDIAATATGLPDDVDKDFQPADVAGARQTRSFAGNVRGYLGPCPPVLHTYEFAVYALDVATLPGVDMNTTRNEAETVILAHDIAKATLSGMYERP
jgi:hypothetical protein